MTDRIQENPPDMRKEYGPLDEVVMHNCTAHLEQMDSGSFYLGLSRGDTHVQVWIGKNGATYEIEDPDGVFTRKG